jgi:2-haloacid dehalogenase
LTFSAPWWTGTAALRLRRSSTVQDGDAFALAWRTGYQPAMCRVMSGRGWTLIDDLHPLDSGRHPEQFGSI